jgi:hypothetical protein
MTSNTTMIHPARDILADGEFLFTEGRLYRMNLSTTHDVEMGSGEFDPGRIDEVELQHMMISEGVADVLSADVGKPHADYAALVEGLVASRGIEKPVPYSSAAAKPLVEKVYFQLRGMLALTKSATRGAGERHSDADPTGEDAELEPA